MRIFHVAITRTCQRHSRKMEVFPERGNYQVAVHLLELLVQGYMDLIHFCLF